MRTMQNILRYITVAALPLLAGCSKYLEKAPDNRTELNSPEKVSQLLGTAYPQANYMTFAEAMSDNVADKGTGTVDIVNATSYKFGDVIDPDQDSPEYYWDACYAAIAAANQALKACETAGNTDAYSSQRGEALVARAYSHFMLVTLFANAYDPATAASDPGIPYVTEPEDVVIKQYQRGTVASVYANIEADLTAGLPLLNDNRYAVPKYHFTKMAANAFACRFYLYKGEFQKAVDHATAALGGGNVTNLLRPWNTSYRTMTFRELFETYARASTSANLLLVEASSVYARQYYTLRYAMTSAKNNAIFGANVTGAQWSFNFQTYTAGTDNYLIPKINEYFVQGSVNANIGLPYVMIPLFTAEELLFNRAEANAWLGNSAAALADLNAYASTRMENYSSSTHNITAAKVRQFYGTSDAQIGIVRTILDFKRAEFAQEGMRWFDILRFRIPVTHRSAAGEVYMLTENDPRRLLQLPQSTSLSGLSPNPR